MTDWIGYRTEIYPPSYRPADTAADHLAFALRYEGIHLEFLHRLFQKLDRTALEAWIAHEPTGQYARRACFLYEWLTGIRIEFAGVTSGNYVDAIDHDRYVTAVAPTRNQRWRVNDNLNHAWLTPRAGRWTTHPQNVLTAFRPT